MRGKGRRTIRFRGTFQTVAFVGAALFVPFGPSGASAAVPSLAIDPTQGRHAISPLIYGINYPDTRLGTRSRR